MPPGRDPSESVSRLFTVADGQAGYFTAAQARAAGYSYPLQHFHVRRGNWFRADRNLFRLRSYPNSTHEDLVRWTFWTLGRGVISHQSALDFHRLGDFVSDRVHLTVPPNFRKSTRDVVLHRGIIAPREIEKHPGFRVTTPSRTILDCADSDVDPERFQDAVHSAFRERRVRRKRLTEGMAALSSRGRLRLASALAKVEAP